MRTSASPASAVSIAREGDTLVVSLTGSWDLRDGLPPGAELERALDAPPPPSRARLETTALDRWDSGLLAFVARLDDLCQERGVALDVSSLPEPARELLELSRGGEDGSPGADGVRGLGRSQRPPPIVDAIGQSVIDWVLSLGDKLDFLGATVLSLGRMPFGRTRRLGLRFTVALQEAGVGTLPVLALIALASGSVLTLIATEQLDKLGAVLLAPKLVGIVILREIGALMTGIALAGRVASANAAELATMVADDEVDALRTVGIDPVELLVAPRVLALVLMGPLLVTYANALGLLGGMLVGVGMMGFPPGDHLDRTLSALSLKHAIAGLVKGAAFGFVVGMAGCYHGLRSGRAHGAVGRAVRTAVVTAVLGVAIADTVLTLFFRWVRL